VVILYGKYSSLHLQMLNTVLVGKSNNLTKGFNLVEIKGENVSTRHTRDDTQRDTQGKTLHQQKMNRKISVQHLNKQNDLTFGLNIDL